MLHYNYSHKCDDSDKTFLIHNKLEVDHRHLALTQRQPNGWTEKEAAQKMKGVRNTIQMQPNKQKYKQLRIGKMYYEKKQK